MAIDLTEYLISKMCFLRLVDAQDHFYTLEEYFTEEIDVTRIVENFNYEYDTNLEFEGSPSELFLFIKNWFAENIKDN